MYTVITENDESQWDDVTGKKYHFPKKYANKLQPGTHVVYYKGRIIKPQFKASRLLPIPHYFGVGIIGRLTPVDSNMNFYAEIIKYRQFNKAVPFQLNSTYLETIPSNKINNYWRDGVREITKEIYDFILSIADLPFLELPKTPDGDLELTTIEEGNQKRIFTTVYERKRSVRLKVIQKHGVTCMCCDINFGDFYGPHGKEFIHVHHLTPISTTGKTKVNPLTDFAVVCPNCHSMIHRKKGKLLSIQEVRNMIFEANGKR